MSAPASHDRLPVISALRALLDHRLPDQIVVTNQGSARIWPQLSRNPLDLHYNPSSMGAAIPLALGLALAQPQRRVLVVSGDGSLLMSLGSLVSVVAAQATNLTIVTLENGLYEVTGGQATPAMGTPLDLAAVAAAAGFPTARRYDDLMEWLPAAATLPTLPGPQFHCLLVGPAPQDSLQASTPPLAAQLAGLKRLLASSPATRPGEQSMVE